MEKIFKVIPSENFVSYANKVEAGIYRDKSLVLAVIDALFSIASKYESTINVVNRFVKRIGIKRENDEYTTSEFLKDFGGFSDEELANDIFKNRQRTSTRNGILKASAVRQVIEIFNTFGIETKEDLLHYHNMAEVENAIKRVKGQASGVSFEYIMMHAGDDNRFKPDRHIYTFFAEVLNYGTLNEKELEKVFFAELEIVKTKYPFFTARSLDSLIWEFIKFSNK